MRSPQNWCRDPRALDVLPTHLRRQPADIIPIRMTFREARDAVIARSHRDPRALDALPTRLRRQPADITPIRMLSFREAREAPGHVVSETHIDAVTARSHRDPRAFDVLPTHLRRQPADIIPIPMMSFREARDAVIAKSHCDPRANATRFTTTLEGFDDSTPLDDLEHYCGRLQETLDRLISLDDTIHDLLPDKEYEEDTETCEE